MYPTETDKCVIVKMSVDVCVYVYAGVRVRVYLAQMFSLRV